MKNTILNIFLAVLFVFGFYLGSFVSFYEDNPCFNLSANAAMTPDRGDGDSLMRLSSLLSGTLSLNFEEEAVPEPEEEPAAPTPDYTTNIPVLTSDSGEKVKIKNDTSYEVDIEELLSEPLVVHSDKIKVLILHTHTSESYTPSEAYPYDMTDSYRTSDEERNVVAVGNVIERVLKENGIEVIHDKTSHDYP